MRAARPPSSRIEPRSLVTAAARRAVSRIAAFVRILMLLPERALVCEPSLVAAEAAERRLVPTPLGPSASVSASLKPI